MREITRPVFVAFDNSEFTTAAACREYERARLHVMLSERSADDILAALNRTNVELADAIEMAGDRIKAARLAAGDRKRKRSGESETQEPVSQPAEPQQPSGEEPAVALEEEDIPESLRRSRDAEMERSEART